MNLLLIMNEPSRIDFMVEIAGTQTKPTEVRVVLGDDKIRSSFKAFSSDGLNYYSDVTPLSSVVGSVTQFSIEVLFGEKIYVPIKRSVSILDKNPGDIPGESTIEYAQNSPVLSTTTDDNEVTTTDDSMIQIEPVEMTPDSSNSSSPFEVTDDNDTVIKAIAQTLMKKRACADDIVNNDGPSTVANGPSMVATGPSTVITVPDARAIPGKFSQRHSLHKDVLSSAGGRGPLDVGQVSTTYVSKSASGLASIYNEVSSASANIPRSSVTEALGRKKRVVRPKLEKLTDKKPSGEIFDKVKIAKSVFTENISIPDSDLQIKISSKGLPAKVPVKESVVSIHREEVFYL